VIQTEGFLYSCFVVVLVGRLVLLGFVMNANGRGHIVVAMMLLLLIPGNISDLMISFFILMILLIVMI
jgi:hypothetical protein